MAGHKSQSSRQPVAGAPSQQDPAASSGRGALAGQDRLGNQAILAQLAAASGGPGRLPHQAEIEASMGTDLSGVLAFTGLGDALRSLGSEAVALGGEAILFADASPDLELVAHEAAHVVQAGPGTAATANTTTAGDRSEQEAGAAAAAVASGGTAQVTGTTAGAIAGDSGGEQVGTVIGTAVAGPIGGVLGGMLGDWLTGPSPEDEMAEFRARTFPPLLDHSASSGGLFDVHLDAATGTLRIVLKVGYDFVSGDPSQVAAGFPAEEFDWTPEEEAAWRTQYQAEVAAQWSGQHQFTSTKEGWDMVIACAVEVTQDDADPHYVLTVSKYPDDAEMVGSAITPKGSNDHGTGRMDSNDIRPEQKLDWGNPVEAIPFGKGSVALNTASAAQVDTIAAMLTSTAGAHVEISGRASSDYPARMTEAEGAEHNMGLARQRSSAVQSRLESGGVSSADILVRNVGSEGATEAEEWCRVDAQTGTQEMQDPGLHETGHMFGLGDEYPTGANPVGSAVRTTYDAILRDELGLEVTRDKTDSAMGSGSTVERWHYVTFLQSLKEISGMPEWTV